MKIGSPEPIAALNRVKICETAEPLVDIRDFCPDVQVMERVCPYLRRTVAEMLNRAQAGLPTGFVLRVGTALRTLSMQKSGWDGYFQRVKEEHPAWPLSALRRATNRYFAPYDQPAPPGHCTGGAVDVALLGPDGEALDLIAPTEGWEAAYTWSDKISPEAKRNRMIMVEAMLHAGFSNCREEYWHYSYGDSAWAVRVGEKTCPYGLVAPQVAVEARFEGGCAAEIRSVEENVWVVQPALAPPPLPQKQAPRLNIGVFWAVGNPITLRFDPSLPLFQSADRETWEPVVLDGDTFALTPTSDRVYLASEPPSDKTDTPSAARDA